MEEQDGEEAAPVKMQMVPLVPTQKMRDEHEASGHAVYRNWCNHCVGGWGLSRQHRKVPHGEEEVATVCSDFFYMGEDDEDAPPFLAVCDRRTKCVSASALPDKATRTASNVRFFGNFIKSLGYQKIVN
jgi:hypothetical protein